MSASPNPSDEHQEDVFSLLSQINYFNNLLEKEQAVVKVKDLFKKEDELEAIKRGITHRLEDLTEHAPPKLKEDIQLLKSHWSKLEINLQDDKEISELLKSSAHELKLQMDRIYYKSFRAEVLAKTEDQPDRITSAVQPYFEGISDNVIGLVEENYPRTIRALFELAVKLKEGHYGQKLFEAFGLFSDSISSYQSLALLLLVDLSRVTPTEELFLNPPEILLKLREDPSFANLFSKMKQMKTEQIEEIILNNSENLTEQEKQFRIQIAKLLDFLNIPQSHWKAFLQIFHQFVANLANPSHLLVDLFLKMDRVEDAIVSASSLPHNVEQSKSLLDIVTYLLNHHHVTEATLLAPKIQNKPEKDKVIVKIVDKLMENKQTDQAIKFAKSLKNSESSNALQEIAVQLGMQDNIDQALAIANLIADLDIKAYTLSRLVNVLTSKGLFQRAMEITFSIEDQSFKEDAIVYIVKSLLNLGQVDGAIAFVESLKNPKEKSLAAKIIDSAMTAYHQDEKHAQGES